MLQLIDSITIIIGLCIIVSPIHVFLILWFLKDRTKIPVSKNILKDVLMGLLGNNGNTPTVLADENRDDNNSGREDVAAIIRDRAVECITEAKKGNYIAALYGLQNLISYI